MKSPRVPPGALPILLAVMLLVGLSLGLRQSLGLIMPPLTRDLDVTVSQFTLAIAIQNLAWGLCQPVAGALGVRYGFRAVMGLGALCYLAGLVTLATAQGRWGVIIGAGGLIGVAMACTGTAVGFAVAARAVPANIRSTILGIVSAASSLGALIAAPIAQAISTGYGWRAGVFGFVAFALLMLPAAWIAGRIDHSALVPATPSGSDALSARNALKVAARHTPFIVMASAYFVCGMQLIFLTTHLPSYLEICGMDPMLGATALGVIGAFNVLGSLFFGWAGGRWSKQLLLGLLYTTRSLVLTWFFLQAPTPTTTIVFAAIMGFLWLGVGPLVAGSVVEMFGLRWQAMIQGVAFMSHQMGSFLGAFGGGAVYDAFGSYEYAWRFGVAMGLIAGILQIVFAIARPPPRPIAPVGA